MPINSKESLSAYLDISHIFCFARFIFKKFRLTGLTNAVVSSTVQLWLMKQQKALSYGPWHQNNYQDQEAELCATCVQLLYKRLAVIMFFAISHTQLVASLATLLLYCRQFTTTYSVFLWQHSLTISAIMAYGCTCPGISMQIKLIWENSNCSISWISETTEWTSCIYVFKDHYIIHSHLSNI